MEAHYDVYARQLFYLDEGFALFEPNPIGQYDEVRVGDFGYILYGKFMKLWNVLCYGPDHIRCGDRSKCSLELPCHCPFVPRKFCGMDDREALSPGPRSSRSFKRRGVEGSLNSSLSGQESPIFAGTSISYSCEKQIGASLITKHRAPCRIATAVGYLKDYMLRHCKTFWTFAREDFGLDMDMHDMVLVTGRRLTGDWATAVVNDYSSSIDLSFRISASVPPFAAGAGLTVWGDWVNSSSVPVRCGPERSNVVPDGEEPDKLDQCIFIRGLRVVDRAWYERLTSKIALRNEDPKPSRIYGPNTHGAKRSIRGLKVEDITASYLREIGGLSKHARNIYEIVAIFIFASSVANVAIIEDKDLRGFSDDYNLAHSTERLCSGQYTVVVTESSEGSLLGRLADGPVSALTNDPKIENAMIVDENFVVPSDSDEDQRLAAFKDNAEPWTGDKISSDDMNDVQGHSIFSYNNDLKSSVVKLLINESHSKGQMVDSFIEICKWMGLWDRISTVLGPNARTLIVKESANEQVSLGQLSPIQLDNAIFDDYGDDDYGGDGEGDYDELDYSGNPLGYFDGREGPRQLMQGRQRGQLQGESEGVKAKPTGACTRCKSLKVRCEFTVGGEPFACQRCMNGGHDCTIPGRKKLRQPSKREHLLNEIRAQAAQIKDLMEKLADANKKIHIMQQHQNSASPAPLIAESGSRVGNAANADVSDNTGTYNPLHVVHPLSRPDVHAWIAHARESFQTLGMLVDNGRSADAENSESGEEDSTVYEAGAGGTIYIVDHRNSKYRTTDFTYPDRTDVESAEVSHQLRKYAPEMHADDERPSSTLRGSPTTTVFSFVPYDVSDTSDGKNAIAEGEAVSIKREDEEEEGYGSARPSFFGARRGSAPDPSGVALPSHPEPQILMRGIVSPKEVELLFSIYFNNMNVSCSLLDPILYTAQNTYWRSPFLFTVICTVASRYYSERPGLYEELTDWAQLAAGTALTSGPKNVETVSAYILLSLYPEPMRRWEEDRTWLYLGLAIRVATDLNLHHPSTKKPRNAAHARELANRTRVWLNCFNLDRSTASWLGKMSTISNDDYIAAHSGEWYDADESNLRNFDIHLASYNENLKLMADFRKRIYSDPKNPTGMNKDMDINAIVTETEERLLSLEKTWVEKFQTETDLEDPQARFRISLIKLAYRYGRLIVISFGFQDEFNKDADHIDKERFFERCYIAAVDVVKVFVEELSTQRVYLRYGPEAQCVFVTFAATFLIKLLHPKYAIFLTKEQRIEIQDSVKVIIDLLDSPEVVVDDKHTPRLWARFLAGLLESPMAEIELSSSALKSYRDVQRHRSAEPSLRSSQNRSRGTRSPGLELRGSKNRAATLPASSASSFLSRATTWTLPVIMEVEQRTQTSQSTNGAGSNYAGNTLQLQQILQHEQNKKERQQIQEQQRQAHQRGSSNMIMDMHIDGENHVHQNQQQQQQMQNALHMNMSEFFPQPLAFIDNDLLQSLQSMPDSSIWQASNMPGFNWLGMLEPDDADTQMDINDPNVIDVGQGQQNASPC